MGVTASGTERPPPAPPAGRPPAGGAAAALATVLVSIAGWGAAIAVDLVAVALAIVLARRTTPQTVALTAVALIVLLAASITLSIWVALRFGRRARRLTPHP